MQTGSSDCTSEKKIRLKGIRKVFIICALLFSYQITDAQNKISGKISDNITGEPVAGATVYIPELKTGTISDQDGLYRIENLPAGRFIVQISFLGYKSIIIYIDLSTTSSKDFVLEQAITEMNEVVITGFARVTEIQKTPVPMITVSNRELQRKLNTNIIDAIAKLPGVSAVTTGPNVSKPYIHGLGNNRVLTLYDGIRQEGQQWGDEHGIEIDENSVDRIEIIKGPASLTYGSDALAGVINLLPAQPVPDGVIKGHAETSYQTNNNMVSVHSALSGNQNGFNWGGVFSHKQASNYRNKYDGRVYGTGFNETNFSGHAGMNKKWGFSDLNFAVYNNIQEIPDGSRDSLTRKFTKRISEADMLRPVVSDKELRAYTIDNLHQHIQHYRIYSSNDFFLGKDKLGVIFGYQQNIRKEYTHPEQPDIPGLHLDLKTITYDLKYSLPLSDGWDATAGLNGMYQVNTSRGTEFIVPDYNQFDIGPFALVTKTFGNLDFSAGARYDTRIYKNINTFSGISGSLGATYNITGGLILKANIARGFRSPNIAEISADGVHPGTLIYQIGNTAFKPEFSLQEDLGISYLSDHISGNLNIYNNIISNYIFNQKLLDHSGQDSVIVRGNQTFKFMQSKAQLYGFDANLDIHPYNWLHIENSISVTYGLNKGGEGINIDDSSKYLPLIPPLRTGTEIRAILISKSKHLRSLYLMIDMEYHAPQNRVYSAYNTETPTSGYFLYNAGFGTDITNNKGKVLVSLNILGNNITNAAYQSHLSRLKYFEPYPDNPTGRNGIYNIGRNISFKVTIPLESQNL